jgi:hypothetical protein
VPRWVKIVAPVAILASFALVETKFDLFPMSFSTGSALTANGSDNTQIISGGNVTIESSTDGFTNDYLSCMQSNSDVQKLVTFDDIIFYNFDKPARYEYLRAYPDSLEFKNGQSNPELLMSLSRICPILDSKLALLQKLVSVDESCSNKSKGRGFISPYSTDEILQAYREQEYSWLKEMCVEFGIN